MMVNVRDGCGHRGASSPPKSTSRSVDDPLQICLTTGRIFGNTTQGAFLASKHFTPTLFTFLRELEVNNEKAWWDANKDRYQTVVRDPALDFITDFGVRLHKLSPHFVADARTSGGSLRGRIATRSSPTTRPHTRPMSASSSDTRPGRTSMPPATTSIWSRAPVSPASASGIPRRTWGVRYGRRSTIDPHVGGCNQGR